MPLSTCSGRLRVPRSVSHLAHDRPCCFLLIFNRDRTTRSEHCLAHLWVWTFPTQKNCSRFFILTIMKATHEITASIRILPILGWKKAVVMSETDTAGPNQAARSTARHFFQTSSSFGGQGSATSSCHTEDRARRVAYTSSRLGCKIYSQTLHMKFVGRTFGAQNNN